MALHVLYIMGEFPTCNCPLGNEGRTVRTPPHPLRCSPCRSETLIFLSPRVCPSLYTWRRVYGWMRFDMSCVYGYGCIRTIWVQVCGRHGITTHTFRNMWDNLVPKCAVIICAFGRAKPKKNTGMQNPGSPKAVLQTAVYGKTVFWEFRAKTVIQGLRT